MLKTLTDYQARECRLCLDGKDLSGAYLMVEAFNTPVLGPRLKLASEADTSDGLFEVVLIKQEAREEWVSFVTSLLREELPEHPAYESYKGRLLEFPADDFAVHYDTVVLPRNQVSAAKKARRKRAKPEEEMIRLELLPGAIRLLVHEPQAEGEPS